VANPLLSLAAAVARILPAPLKRQLYKLGPLSRGLRGALNSAAPQGLVEMQVAAGGLQGAKLLLDMQTEKDYWLGTYEQDLQQAIRDWVEPGNVIYDLGANIGYVSLLFARATGSSGRVLAFEPLPANQQRLQKNLNLNNTLNVSLIPAAVADKSGSTTFMVHSSGGMGKLKAAPGRSEGFAQEISVQTIALDDFAIANPIPQLIKIDIEGGEVLALRGMSTLLRERRPILFLELHGPEATAVAWDRLRTARYHLHWMRGDYSQIMSASELTKKSYVIARPA
jgi:FkbM family methyltransferase